MYNNIHLQHKYGENFSSVIDPKSKVHLNGHKFEQNVILLNSCKKIDSK